MKCKCRLCGAQLDSKTAFKISGKPNKYYCSESEWVAEEERKKKAAEDKNKVYKLICVIMGRQQIVNSALWKEFAEWNKVADNEKIVQYLEENKDYLTQVVSRLDSSEYARIRYVSAILKNSLGDFKPKAVNEPTKIQPKVVIDETVYEPPKHSLNRRRSLAELEDEI